MVEARIVAAILARLTVALAPPREPRVPLRLDGLAVGWLDHRRAARLASFRDVFDVRADVVAFVASLADAEARSAALARVARVLAAEGELSAWRDERYAVARAFGAEPLFVLERAAARYFGVRTYAAHVNGVVRDGEKVSMWLARRSPAKVIDPGLLDNLVGGGVAAGQSIEATLAKEAHEEAAIDEATARGARRAGTVEICRARPDGLQRETIFVHDLELPPTFRPVCVDGEAVEHRLVALEEAARLVANAAGPDVATADASLVVTDYLLRHDLVSRAAPEYAALAALRHPPCPFGD